MDPEVPWQPLKRFSFGAYLCVVLLIALLAGSLTTWGYVKDIRSMKLDTNPQESQLWAVDISSAVTIVHNRPAYPKPQKARPGSLLPAPKTEFKQYRNLYKAASAARKDAVVGVILQGAPVGNVFKYLASKLDPKRDALELRMWKDLLVLRRVDKAQLSAYVAMAKKLDLGPWNDGLLFGLYAAAGDKGKAETAQARLWSRATNAVAKLGALILGAAVVILIGFVLLVMFLNRHAAGLRSLPVLSRLDGVSLIKAFLVYFLGFNVLSVVPHGLIAGTRLAHSASAKLAATFCVQFASCWLALKSYSLSIKASEEESRWAREPVPELAFDSDIEELTEPEPIPEPSPEPLPAPLPFKLDSTAVKWGIGGFCAATVLSIAAVLVTNLVAYVFGIKLVVPEHPLMEQLGKGTLPIVLAIAAAAIAAPITEEIAFRGFLFGSLRAKHGFWVACLLSSAIFAIIHPTVPVQFLGLMALGVVFCVVREKTGNLAASMVAHAVNNLVMFIIQLTVLKPW